jgi:hypothetical protein
MPPGFSRKARWRYVDQENFDRAEGRLIINSLIVDWYEKKRFEEVADISFWMVFVFDFCGKGRLYKQTP